MQVADLDQVLNTLVGLGKENARLNKELEVPRVYDLNGKPYVTARDCAPLREPCPAAITVATLTGLVDYLTVNVDGLALDECICHVENPTKVSVYSKLFGAHEQRKAFIVALAAFIPSIRIDTWLEAEDFNLMLMSCFVDNEDRKKVLSIAGNIVASTEIKNLDDGVSQEASVKSGIRRLENQEVPNPVSLKPYRTFTDVPQPDGMFVFRMRQTDGVVQCALFDATGGAWKGEAMDSIRQYIKKEAPSAIKVIA